MEQPRSNDESREVKTDDVRAATLHHMLRLTANALARRLKELQDERKSSASPSERQ